MARGAHYLSLHHDESHYNTLHDLGCSDFNEGQLDGWLLKVRQMGA